MENQKNKKYDIRERALDFAVAVAIFVSKLPRVLASMEYGKQLLRSSASVGANIEEADGTLSKKDFTNKMAIARRECRETRYWLRLIKAVLLTDDPEKNAEAFKLSREAEEILLILSSIINNARARL